MRDMPAGFSQSRPWSRAIRCTTPASRTALWPGGAGVPTTTPAAAPAPSNSAPSVIGPEASGEARSCTGWAATAGDADMSASRQATANPLGMALSLHLGVGLQHLVGGRDHLRIHLVGALRHDQRGDLAYRVDVRGLGVALQEGAQPLH